MTRTRATDPAQKAARRAAILRAAAEVSAEHGLDRVTVQAVADRAGLAKGTVYLYVQTKEELFLLLLAEQVRQWVEDLPEELRDRGGRAATVVDSLLERPLLIELLAVLHVILERNLAFESAAEFKRSLARHLETAAHALAGCVPDLTPDRAARFLMRLHAAVIGLHQMASHSPVMAKVLDSDPDLAIFQITFAQELHAVASALFERECTP